MTTAICTLHASLSLQLNFSDTSDEMCPSQNIETVSLSIHAAWPTECLQHFLNLTKPSVNLYTWIVFSPRLLHFVIHHKLVQCTQWTSFITKERYYKCLKHFHFPHDSTLYHLWFTTAPQIFTSIPSIHTSTQLQAFKFKKKQSHILCN